MLCFSDVQSKQLGQHAVGSEVSLGNSRDSLHTALLLTFVRPGVYRQMEASSFRSGPLSPVLVLLSTKSTPEESLSLLLSFVS